ncbi:MFS transporter [Rhabdothermincola salaria]|uniref:MFS transporter n=1 Tax=Rhabdothermincola salaria TaxID=2903142 RepID=UPI001E388CEC|nr:MFS transporter [Rhabdothermincola salaria]
MDGEDGIDVEDVSGDPVTSPSPPADHVATAPVLASSTFAAMAVPAYRKLWFSGLFVFMAVNAQAIARGWLARELTGTNAGLGGVLLAFGIAMLISTPFGGVAADRLPKRTVLVVSQLLLVASSMWIGVALVLDVVEYWMLMGASALQAVAFALFGPARMSYTAEIVDGRILSNAIVLAQMGAEGMRVIGPTIAGIVIAAFTWGLEGVFIASGALCLFGTVLTVFLPPAPPHPERIHGSPWGELADGLRYVRRRPDLALLVTSSLVIVMIGYPFMAFLPTVADGIFDTGSTGYGVLSAASAVGAIAFGLFAARSGGRRDPWRFVTVAGIGFGVGLITLGLMPLFWLAVVALMFTGGMSLTYQTMTNSLLLNLSDFDYHGRIQSLVMLGFSGFGIAALPLGALADAIGLRTTFVIMGAVVLVVMVVFVLRRRRFSDREVVLGLG